MTRNARITLLVIATFHVASVQAQHTPLTSQYLLNGLLLNPAYAGTRDAFTANLTWRQQWVGFEGAPSTQMMSVHSPVNRTNLALGVILYSDQIGVSRETGALANFAYRVPFRRGKLHMGIGAGASYLQADWNRVTLQDRSDVQFATNTNGAIQPNFSAGVFYYKKNYFLGASVPFAMSHRFDPESSNWTIRANAAQLQPMVTGGYVFKLNRELKLKPSTLIRYQIASGVQADLNASLIIKDRIWTGISYRTMDALVGSFEVVPTSQWRLGYAYDLGMSQLRPYHHGTHEITVQYEFGKRLQVRDPRYF
jgi:type IX secretion system PorP/SprF family membrane protein